MTDHRGEGPFAIFRGAIAPGLAVVALLLAVGPAAAGPPFVTDDPAPTDLGHWEIYNFVTAARAEGAWDGEAGLDLNYGAAKDLQLTLVLPAAFHADGAAALGPGVVEAAAKLRVLHQLDGTLIPDLAIFPRAFVPTSRRFGPARANLLLPVWAEKDFGPWSVFGGGGYQVNPGRDHRDYWTGGLTLARAIDKQVTVGVEVYHHTRDAADARPFTGANLGVLYRVAPHWSLLAAGGPGLENARSEGQAFAYVALKADY